MSNEIDIFAEEDKTFDASTLEGVQAEKGKQLAGLVRQLNSIQQQIEDAEQHLKALKKDKQRIAFEHIPMLMDEMSMERIDVDGLVVKLKPFVTASIPADRKQDAFNWLREHGLDDIIKNDIIVSFGRGQDNQAGDVMYDLEQKGFHPEQKTHIHSMTLKAFVRERVEKGLPIDLDMFGAFVARTAEIKRNSK